MSGAQLATGSPIDVQRLRAALEYGLANHFPSRARITRIARFPSPYRTSHALEEIKVRLADGTNLNLLFKDCSRQALLEEAAIARPDFVIDPGRELDVYRHWLKPAGLGTAMLYAHYIDEPSETFGLFLEHVQGRELYQVGEFELWQTTARWLARFHAYFAETSGRKATGLPRCDSDQCRQWLDHANVTIRGRAKRDSWKRIASTYATTIEHFSSLPATLIHGEFFASNVLLSDAEKGLRVCPIDWEMAAIGPGLLDVAALVAGSWTEDQKLALAASYVNELQAIGADIGRTAQEFSFDLDVCRLHLAVQRTGWSARWTPPAEHRCEWWNDASKLAQRIATKR